MSKSTTFLLSYLFFMAHIPCYSMELQEIPYITPDFLFEEYENFYNYMNTKNSLIKLYCFTQTTTCFMRKTPFIGRKLAAFSNSKINSKIKSESIKRGYDEFSFSLSELGINYFKLDTWKSDAENLCNTPSDEDIEHMNSTITTIIEHINNQNIETGTMQALNSMIFCLHQSTVHKLIDDEETKEKAINNQQLENGTYFFVEYMKNNSQAAKYSILNMFVTFLFEKYNLITELQ